MKQVAKLIIVDPNDQYLMMYRNAHPHFGDDPDLPGGTLENGENPLDAMIREVFEESGVSVDRNAVRQIYDGDAYSKHSTHYVLYVTKMRNRPNITMSWEHKSYEWVSRTVFLGVAKTAKDTYMQMVHETMCTQNRIS